MYKYINIFLIYRKLIHIRKLYIKHNQEIYIFFKLNENTFFIKIKKS